MDTLTGGPRAVNTHSQCHPGREVVGAGGCQRAPLCVLGVSGLPLSLHCVH